MLSLEFQVTLEVVPNVTKPQNLIYLDEVEAAGKWYVIPEATGCNFHGHWWNVGQCACCLSLHLHKGLEGEGLHYYDLWNAFVAMLGNDHPADGQD